MSDTTPREHLLSTAGLLFVLTHLCAAPRQTEDLRFSAWRVLRALAHVLLPEAPVRVPLLVLEPGQVGKQVWALVAADHVDIPVKLGTAAPERRIQALARAAQEREVVSRAMGAAVAAVPPALPPVAALPTDPLPPVAALPPQLALPPPFAPAAAARGPADTLAGDSTASGAAVAALPPAALEAPCVAVAALPPAVEVGAVSRPTLPSLLVAAYKTFDDNALAQLLKFLSNIVNAQLRYTLEGPSSSAGAASSTAALPALASDSKRRRLDEACLDLDVEDVRAINAARKKLRPGLGRVTSITQARRNTHKFLLKYWNAGRELFQGQTNVCLALDASRVGLQEVLMIAMYNHTKDTAMWLPPQVQRLSDF